MSRKGNAEYSEKVIWDCEKFPGFLSFLSQQARGEELSHALNEVEVNVDSVLDRFVNCLLNAATCMKKRVAPKLQALIKDSTVFFGEIRSTLGKRQSK